jgi:hypothetical protein
LDPLKAEDSGDRQCAAALWGSVLCRVRARRSTVLKAQRVSEGYGSWGIVLASGKNMALSDRPIVIREESP